MYIDDRLKLSSNSGSNFPYTSPTVERSQSDTGVEVYGKLMSGFSAVNKLNSNLSDSTLDQKFPQISA